MVCDHAHAMNGDDEKKMKKMKEDIEADFDSLAKKLRNFCEFGVRDDSTGLEGLDIEGFTTMWKGLGGSRTWRTTTHVPDQEQDGTSENESDSDSDADMVAMSRRMHKAHSDYDARVTSDEGHDDINTGAEVTGKVCGVTAGDGGSTGEVSESEQDDEDPKSRKPKHKDVAVLI